MLSDTDNRFNAGEKPQSLIGKRAEITLGCLHFEIQRSTKTSRRGYRTYIVHSGIPGWLE